MAFSSLFCIAVLLEDIALILHPIRLVSKTSPPFKNAYLLSFHHRGSPFSVSVVPWLIYEAVVIGCASWYRRRVSMNLIQRCGQKKRAVLHLNADHIIALMNLIDPSLLTRMCIDQMGCCLSFSLSEHYSIVHDLITILDIYRSIVP